MPEITTDFYNNRLKRQEPEFFSTREFRSKTSEFFSNTNIDSATLYSVPSIYREKLKPGSNVTVNVGGLEMLNVLEQQQYVVQNNFDHYGFAGSNLHFKSYVGVDSTTGKLKGFITSANQSAGAMGRSNPFKRFIAGGEQTNTGLVLTDEQDIKDLLTVQKGIRENNIVESAGNFQVGSKLKSTLTDYISQAGAKDVITLASPFVDDPTLLKELIQAKRRGAEVNIIASPGPVQDETRGGARTQFARKAEKYGLNVYSSNALQHQKDLVISGNLNLTVTGSSNFTSASFSNRTLDYSYVLQGQSALQQEIQNNLFETIQNSELHTGHFSKLDTLNEYSFTRRAAGTQYLSDSLGAALETVANMPTSLSQEFFDRYRGQELPTIEMYRTRYETLTGKKAPSAVIAADKALSTPSLGEQINRAIGFQVYHKGEGLIGSAFRTVGRLLDKITGQDLAYNDTLRFTGELRGGISKYSALDHKELQAPEGLFENLLANTALNAKGFAVGVFSLGASLSTTYALSAALQTGLISALGKDSPISGQRKKSFAANSLTLFYRYTRTFQRSLVESFLPGIIDFITPDNDYIKAKQRAVIHGGEQLKTYIDKYGSVKEHAKEVKYITELVGNKGLLDVIGEDVDTTEFREGNVTTLGKNRLERIGKRYEVLLSTIPINPLNWLPGFRNLTNIESLSDKEYSQRSVKAVYGQNFLHRAIDTVYSSVKSVLDITEDPTKYYQAANELFEKTKEVNLNEKELEKRFSSLVKKVKAGSYHGKVSASRLQTESLSVVEQLDLVSNQAKNLAELSEKRFYYKQGVKPGDSISKPSFIAGNIKTLGLIGGLLFADYALENTLYSSQGLDLHQQLSLFKAVKTEDGNILGFEFNGTVPAVTNALVVGTAAATAGRLLPKFEVTNLLQTEIGRKAQQAVTIAEASGDDVLRQSTKELLTKVSQTSIVKTKFNYLAASVAGLATLAAVKTGYGLYAQFLNSQYANPKAGDLDEVLESAASKVRSSLLSYDSLTGNASISSNKEYLRYLLGELNSPKEGSVPLSETHSAATQVSLGIGQLSTLVKFEPGKKYGSLSFGFQLLPAFGIGFTPTAPVGLKLRRDDYAYEINQYIPEEGYTLENQKQVDAKSQGFLTLNSLLRPFDGFVYEKESSFLAGSMFLGASLYTKSIINLGQKYVLTGGGGWFGDLSRAIAKEADSIKDFTTVATGVAKGVEQLTRFTTSLSVSLPLSYGKAISDAFTSGASEVVETSFFQKTFHDISKFTSKLGPLVKKSLPFYLGMSLATALTDPYMGVDSREEESIFYNPINRIASVGLIGIGGSKIAADLLNSQKKTVYESLPVVGKMIAAEKEIIRTGSTVSKYMARASLLGAGLFTASLLSKFVVRAIGNTSGEAGLESFYDTPIGGLFRIASGIDSEEYAKQKESVNPLLSLAGDFFSALTLNKFNFKDTLGIYKDQPNLFLPMLGTNQGLSFKEEKGFGSYYQMQGASVDLSFAKYELFKASTNKDQILTLSKLVDLDPKLAESAIGTQLVAALSVGAVARKTRARYTKYTNYELSAIKSSSQSLAASVRSFLVERISNQRAVENRLAGIKEGILTGNLQDVEGFDLNKKVFNPLDELEVIFNYSSNYHHWAMVSGGFGNTLEQSSVFDYVTNEEVTKFKGPSFFNPGAPFEFMNKLFSTKEDATPTGFAAAAFNVAIAPFVAVALVPSLFLYNQNYKEQFIKKSYAVANAEATEIIEDFTTKAGSRRFFKLDSVDDGVYFGHRSPGSVLRKIDAPTGVVDQQKLANALNYRYGQVTKLMEQRLKGNFKGGFVDSIKQELIDKVGAGASTKELRDNFVDFLKRSHYQTIRVDGKDFNSLELFYGIKSEDEFVEKVGSLIPEDEYEKLEKRVKTWRDTLGMSKNQIRRRLRIEVSRIEARTYNQFYTNFGRAENYVGDELDEVISVSTSQAPKSIIGSAFAQSGRIAQAYGNIVLSKYGIAESAVYLLSGNQRERQIASEHFVKNVGVEIAVGAATNLTTAITKQSGLVSLGLGLATLGVYNALKSSGAGRNIQNVEDSIGGLFADVVYNVSGVLNPLFSPVAGAIRKTIFEPLGGVIETAYNKMSKKSPIMNFFAQALLPTSMFKAFDAPTSRRTYAGVEPFIYGSSNAVAEYLRQERADKIKGLSSINQPIDLVHGSLLGQVNSYIESEKYNLYFRTSPSGRQSASALSSFSPASVFRLSATQRLAIKRRQEMANWANYGANMRRPEEVGSTKFADFITSLISVSSKVANREGVSAVALFKEDINYYKDFIYQYLPKEGKPGALQSFKDLAKSVRSLIGNLAVPQSVKDELTFAKKIFNKTVASPVNRTTKELLKQTFREYKSNFVSISKGAGVTLRAFSDYLSPAGEAIVDDYSRVGATIGAFALDIFKDIKGEVGNLLLPLYKATKGYAASFSILASNMNRQFRHAIHKLGYDRPSEPRADFLNTILKKSYKTIEGGYYKGNRWAGFGSEAYKDVKKEFFTSQNKRRLGKLGRAGFNFASKSTPAVIDLFTLASGVQKLNELNPVDDIYDLYMGRTTKLTSGREAQELYSAQGSAALGILAGSIATGIFAAPILPALIATAAFSYIGNQLGTQLAIGDMRNKEDKGMTILNLLSMGAAASTVFSTFMTAVAPKRGSQRRKFNNARPAAANKSRTVYSEIDDPWKSTAKVTPGKFTPEEIPDPWLSETADVGEAEAEARRFVRSLEPSRPASTNVNKPKSFVKTFHFFDIETSGLRKTDVADVTTSTPEILQIARKTVQIDMRTGEMVEISSADGFIRPNTPLDELEYTPKFGVEKLETQGRTFNQTFDSVMGPVFDNNSSSVIAGHNIRSFDIQVVAENLRRQGRHAEAEMIEQASKLDTLKDISADHYSGMGLTSRKLERAYQQLTGETLEGAHTADADVNANVKLFREMILSGELDPDTLEFLDDEQRAELKEIYKQRRIARSSMSVYDSPIGPRRPKSNKNSTTTAELTNTQAKLKRNRLNPNRTVSTSKGLHGKLNYKSTLVDVFEAADILEKSTTVLLGVHSSLGSFKSALGLANKKEMNQHVMSNTATAQGALIGAFLSSFGVSAPSRVLGFAGGFIASKFGVDLTFGLSQEYRDRELQRIEESGVYADGVGNHIATHLAKKEVQTSLSQIPQFIKENKFINSIDRKLVINRGLRAGIAYFVSGYLTDRILGKEYDVDTGYKRNPLIDTTISTVAAVAAATIDSDKIEQSRNFKKATAKVRRFIRKYVETAGRHMNPKRYKDIPKGNRTTESLDDLFNQVGDPDNFVTGPEMQAELDAAKAADRKLFEQGQQDYQQFKNRTAQARKDFRRSMKKNYIRTSKFLRNIKNNILNRTDAYWNSSRTSLKIGSGIFLGGTALATLGLMASNDDSTNLYDITKDLGKTGLAFGSLAYLSLNAEKVATGLTQRINNLDERIKASRTTPVSRNYSSTATKRMIGSAGAVGASAVALAYIYNLTKNTEEKENQKIDPLLAGAAGFMGKMTFDSLYYKSVQRRATGKSVYKILRQDRINFNKFISTTGRQYGTAGSAAALTYLLTDSIDKDNQGISGKGVLSSTVVGAGVYGLSKSRLANARMGKYGSAALMGAAIGAIGEKTLFGSDKPTLGTIAGAGLGAYIAFGASRNQVLSGIGDKANKVLTPYQIYSSGAGIASGVTSLMTSGEFDYDKKAVGYQNITTSTYSLLSLLGSGTSLASIPLAVAGGFLNARQAQQRSEMLDASNADTIDYATYAAEDLTFQIKTAALSNLAIKAFQKKTFNKSLMRIATLTKDASRSKLISKGLTRGLKGTGKMIPGKLKRFIDPKGIVGGALKTGAELVSKVLDVAEITIGSTQFVSGLDKFRKLSGASTNEEVDLAYQQTFRGAGRVAGTVAGSVAAKFLYGAAAVAGATGLGAPIAVGLAGLGLVADVYGGDIGAAISSGIGKVFSSIHNAIDYKQIKDKRYKPDKFSSYEIVGMSVGEQNLQDSLAFGGLMAAGAGAIYTASAIKYKTFNPSKLFTKVNQASKTGKKVGILGLAFDRVKGLIKGFTDKVPQPEPFGVQKQKGNIITRLFDFSDFDLKAIKNIKRESEKTRDFLSSMFEELDKDDYFGKLAKIISPFFVANSSARVSSNAVSLPFEILRYAGSKLDKEATYQGSRLVDRTKRFIKNRSVALAKQGLSFSGLIDLGFGIADVAFGSATNEQYRQTSLDVAKRTSGKVSKEDLELLTTARNRQAEVMLGSIAGFTAGFASKNMLIALAAGVILPTLGTNTLFGQKLPFGLNLGSKISQKDAEAIKRGELPEDYSVTDSFYTKVSKDFTQTRETTRAVLRPIVKPIEKAVNKVGKVLSKGLGYLYKGFKYAVDKTFRAAEVITRVATYVGTFGVSLVGGISSLVVSPVFKLLSKTKPKGSAKTVEQTVEQAAELSNTVNTTNKTRKSFNLLGLLGNAGKAIAGSVLKTTFNFATVMSKGAFYTAELALESGLPQAIAKTGFGFAKVGAVGTFETLKIGADLTKFAYKYVAKPTYKYIAKPTYKYIAKPAFNYLVKPLAISATKTAFDFLKKGLVGSYYTAEIAFDYLAKPAFNYLAKPAFKYLAKPAFNYLIKPAFNRLVKPLAISATKTVFDFLKKGLVGSYYTAETLAEIGSKIVPPVTKPFLGAGFNFLGKMVKGSFYTPGVIYDAVKSSKNLKAPAEYLYKQVNKVSLKSSNRLVKEAGNRVLLSGLKDSIFNTLGVAFDIKDIYQGTSKMSGLDEYSSLAEYQEAYAQTGQGRGSLSGSLFGTIAAGPLGDLFASVTGSMLTEKYSYDLARQRYEERYTRTGLDNVVQDSLDPLVNDLRLAVAAGELSKHTIVKPLNKLTANTIGKTRIGRYAVVASKRAGRQVAREASKRILKATGRKISTKAVAKVGAQAAEGGLLKAISRKLPGLQYAFDAYDVLAGSQKLITAGEDTTQARAGAQQIGRGLGSAAGSAVGGKAGMYIGAAVGSLLGPVGTIAGGVIGGAIGSVVGGIVGGYAGEFLGGVTYDYFKPVGELFNKPKITNEQINQMQIQESNFGRASIAAVVTGGRSVLSQLIGSLGFQRQQKRTQAIQAQSDSSNNWLSKLFGFLGRVGKTILNTTVFGAAFSVGSLASSAVSTISNFFGFNRAVGASTYSSSRRRGYRSRGYSGYSGGGFGGTTQSQEAPVKTVQQRRQEFREQAKSRVMVAAGLADDTSSTGKVKSLKIQGSELDLVKRLLVAEAGSEGTLGMALVARSLLNRQAMVVSGTVGAGTYNAKSSSLTDLIYARNQFQPIRDGAINKSRTAAQLKQAEEALKLAFDTQAITAQLKKEGKSEDTIKNLLQATGFRAGYAFDDPSQNYKRTGYKNHIFNSDKFASKQNVESLFNKYAAHRNAVIENTIKKSKQGGVDVKGLIDVVKDSIGLEISLLKEEIEESSVSYGKAGKRYDSRHLMSTTDSSYAYRKSLVGSEAQVTIKGTKLQLSSGYGGRERGIGGLGSARHPGIDIVSPTEKVKMTSPFAKAIVEQADTSGIRIAELDSTTNKKTGRGVLFIHSSDPQVKVGQTIKFNKVVSHEGLALTRGRPQDEHSHMTIYVEGEGVTIDKASTMEAGGYGGLVNKSTYAPNLEEIKATHGYGKAPLPLVRRVGSDYKTVSSSEQITQSRGLIPQGSYITLTDSGKKLSNGAPILSLNMYKDGKLVKTVTALSGKPSGLDKDRNTPDVNAALPEGVWNIGAMKDNKAVDYNNPDNILYGVGDKFLELNPTFSTKRTAIGIHYDKDKDRQGGLGSAGCVVLEDIKTRNIVYDFVKRNSVKKFYVDITSGDDTDLAKPGQRSVNPAALNKEQKEKQDRLKHLESVYSMVGQGKFFGPEAQEMVYALLKESGAKEAEIVKVKKAIIKYNTSLPKAEQQRAAKAIAEGKDPNGLKFNRPSQLTTPPKVSKDKKQNPIDKLKPYISPKANLKDWKADDQKDYKKIYLTAGHTDHSSGTSGASGQALSYAPGRSAESVVTKEIMLAVKRLAPEYGVSVEIDTPTSKESSHKPQVDRAVKKEKEGYYAVEIHLDAPIGMGGTGSGLIPSYNGQAPISKLDDQLAKEYGAFSKHHRDGLYATKRGISLLEVDVFQGETEKVIRYGSKKERDAYYEFQARRFLQTISGEQPNVEASVKEQQGDPLFQLNLGSAVESIKKGVTSLIPKPKTAKETLNSTLQDIIKQEKEKLQPEKTDFSKFIDNVKTRLETIRVNRVDKTQPNLDKFIKNIQGILQSRARLETVNKTQAELDRFTTSVRGILQSRVKAKPSVKTSAEPKPKPNFDKFIQRVDNLLQSQKEIKTSFKAEKVDKVVKKDINLDKFVSPILDILDQGKQETLEVLQSGVSLLKSKIKLPSKNPRLKPLDPGLRTESNTSLDLLNSLNHFIKEVETQEKQYKTKKQKQGKGYSITKLTSEQTEQRYTVRKIRNFLKDEVQEVYIKNASGNIEKKKLREYKLLDSVFIDESNTEVLIQDFKTKKKQGRGISKNNPLQQKEVNIVMPSAVEIKQGSFLMPTTEKDALGGIQKLQESGYEVLGVVGSGYISYDKKGVKKGVGYRFTRLAGQEKEVYGDDRLSINRSGYVTYSSGKTELLDLSKKTSAEAQKIINNLKKNKSVIGIQLTADTILEANKPRLTARHATEENVARSFLMFGKDNQIDRQVMTGQIDYRDQALVAGSIDKDSKVLVLDGDYYARRALFDEKGNSALYNEAALANVNPVFLVRKAVEKPKPFILPTKQELEALEAEGLAENKKQDIERIITSPEEYVDKIFNKLKVKEKIGESSTKNLAYAAESVLKVIQPVLVANKDIIVKELTALQSEDKLEVKVKRFLNTYSVQTSVFKSILDITSPVISTNYKALKNLKQFILDKPAEAAELPIEEDIKTEIDSYDYEETEFEDSRESTTAVKPKTVRAKTYKQPIIRKSPSGRQGRRISNPIKMSRSFTNTRTSRRGFSTSYNQTRSRYSRQSPQGRAATRGVRGMASPYKPVPKIRHSMQGRARSSGGKTSNYYSPENKYAPGRSMRYGKPKSRKVVVKNTPRASTPNKQPGIVQRTINGVQRFFGFRKGSIVVSVEYKKSDGAKNIISNTGINGAPDKVTLDPTLRNIIMGNNA